MSLKIFGLIGFSSLALGWLTVLTSNASISTPKPDPTSSTLSVASQQPASLAPAHTSVTQAFVQIAAEPATPGR